MSETPRRDDRPPTDEELAALQEELDQDAAADAVADLAGDAPDSTEAEIDPLISAEGKIAELEVEMAALKDRALRAMADAENVKKRAEREVAASKVYSIERFAIDMLSVHDNLARALQSLHGTNREELGENAKNLLDGIELTEKDLIAVLSRHGVKPVPGKGSKFDPNVHQAVAQIPSDETKGDIAEVMQTGFTLGDRTLRAAMVAVSTGPTKS